MKRSIINIDNYWKVIIYYNIDYNLFQYIRKDLQNIGVSADQSKLILSKAFTISNLDQHISLVGINSTNDYYDYLNSVVHEAEHIKQDMLKAYEIEDKGELPAYTIGYIVQEILKYN